VKLENFITVRTGNVMNLNNQYMLKSCFDAVAPYYKKSYNASGNKKSARGKKSNE